MNAQILTADNIEEYLPLIPPELPNMELRALHFIGISVFERPVGVLIWKESKTNREGSLLYLYVMPEFRGIGAGGKLFSLLREGMKESGTKTLFINYPAEDDKGRYENGTALLTNFLIKEGCDLESLELKKGYVYLSEAVQSLEDYGLTKSERNQVQSLKKLPDRRKNRIRLWIEDNLSIDSRPYFSAASLSFASLENDVLTGLLLVLIVKDQIRMDHLYTAKKSPLTLAASLIASSSNEAKKTLSGDDPLIEAVLLNKQTKKIWKMLFGEPSFRELYISGEFSPGKLLIFEE